MLHLYSDLDCPTSIIQNLIKSHLSLVTYNEFSKSMFFWPLTLKFGLSDLDYLRSTKFYSLLINISDFLNRCFFYLWPDTKNKLLSRKTLLTVEGIFYNISSTTVNSLVTWPMSRRDLIHAFQKILILRREHLFTLQ